MCSDAQPNQQRTNFHSGDEQKKRRGAERSKVVSFRKLISRREYLVWMVYYYDVQTS